MELEDEADVASLAGRTFRLFDWTGVTPIGRFDLASTLQWDTSRLYTTGEVTLVPEPTGIALLALGSLGLLKRRRQ